MQGAPSAGPNRSKGAKAGPRPQGGRVFGPAFLRVPKVPLPQKKMAPSRKVLPYLLLEIGCLSEIWPRMRSDQHRKLSRLQNLLWRFNMSRPSLGQFHTTSRIKVRADALCGKEAFRRGSSLTLPAGAPIALLLPSSGSRSSLRISPRPSRREGNARRSPPSCSPSRRGSVRP